MSDLKILKWCEPYNGWDTFDTGLCNRILHWEIAYDFSVKYKKQPFCIHLEKRHWPEHRLLYLPETNFIDNVKYKHNDQYKLEFITVYDHVNNTTKQALPITPEMIKAYKENREINLSGSNYWFADFGYMTLLELDKFKFNNNIRGLKRIELVHKKYEQLLKVSSKNIVGIHIRRGNGVNITTEDIDSLPENIRESYKESTKKFKFDTYGFVRDEVYFRIMDELLLINPHQKFYISHDQPTEFMVHYKERYGDNVIFKEDVMLHVTNFFRNIGMDIEVLNEGYALDNVTDLFSLAFGKMVITSNISTWSHFAKSYIDVPSIDAEADIKVIKTLYREKVYRTPLI